MVRRFQLAGMSVFASARRRVPRAAALAAGDGLVLAGIVAAGMVSHGTNPFLQPVETVETVGPFLLGWVVLAGLLGLYDDPSPEYVTALRRTIACWIGAANVGLILRGSPFLAGGITWPFPLVITGFGAVGLVAWRVVALLAMRTVVTGDGFTSGEGDAPR